MWRLKHKVLRVKKITKISKDGIFSAIGNKNEKRKRHEQTT